MHLETIKDVKKALAEFYRVLRPRGVLYVSVKAQMGDEKMAVVSDSLSKHERFFRYHTEEELTALIEGAEFGVIETSIEDDMHGRSEVQWLEIIARK